MDDPLREMDAKAKDGAVVVLILVVMDDPLRALYKAEKRDLFQS